MRHNNVLRGWMSAAGWIVLVLLVAGNAKAEPEKPPQGFGKYVMVLWEPGTPLPNGGQAKRTEDPDVVKIGGRVLQRNANFVEIFLPLGQAKQLRRHPAVSYLQRIWMGESLEGWDETYPAVSSRNMPQSETDPAVTWGPQSFEYDGSGNIKTMGPNHYVYDTAGRLIQAEVNGKTETYKYDSFGNMTERAISGAAAIAIPVDPASNRLRDRSYDAAGNVVGDLAGGEYSYDGTGMLAWARRGSTEWMIYDASDERLGRITQGRRPQWTIRDFSGRVLREFQSQEDMNSWTWYWKQDYVYADGVLVAGETQTWTNGSDPSSYVYGGERHYHLDHLGSVRIVSNADGRSLVHRDYYPYGIEQSQLLQEQMNWGDGYVDKARFAGHTRDYFGVLDEGTNYLDYMHARYYDPNVGRFLSVDPVLDSVNLLRPQTWNRYAYALNNPVRNTDPTGLYTMTCAEGMAADKCAAQKDAFEANLETQRKSADEEIAAAASIYGARNVDNGVSVQIVPNLTNSSGNRINGSHRPSFSQAGTILHTIQITGGLDATSLGHAIVHEGKHALTAIPFGESVRAGQPDAALNLSTYDAEMVAYLLSHRYVQLNNANNGAGFKYNGLTLKPMTPVAMVRRDIDKFLRGKGLVPGPSTTGKCQWAGFCLP